MNLKIAEMLPQDVAEVALMEKEIFSMPWSEKGFLDFLRLPDTLYLVAREDGRLVGYCGFLQSFEEADITNVAVSPKCQDRGVGRQMLEELMARGKERGVCRYTLEVRVSNARAVHLYQKLGFEPVGIRRNFYEMPREDAVIMWTGLSCSQ